MTDLIWHLHTWTIPAALSLLPAQMSSKEAVAEMLAIGLQESAFKARRQHGNGPAMGLWQFEKMGGVNEILTSPDTIHYILPICDLLLVRPTPAACHEVIQNHDVLAACFARLLLWRDSRAMPLVTEPDKGWSIYLRNWRPGKPHPKTWRANFEQAWAVVNA